MASDQELSALTGDFLKAQLAGDQRSALKVINSALAAGHDALSLQRSVIAAAQEEVGRLWEQNRVSVAHEHMATAIAQTALALIFSQSEPTAALGKRALVACVEGELHDLPARMVADCLELSGYEVNALGANVPLASLLTLLDKESYDVLALSVTMTFHLDALRRAVPAVRERHSHLPIVVGGRAVSWSRTIAEELGVVVGGATPREIADAVQHLVELR